MSLQKPTISFEFFPPKTDKGRQNLWRTIDELVKLGPAFMTVTYGAGGASENPAIETALSVNERYPDIPAASHLTYIDTPIAEIDEIVDTLWNKGVKHIVALRGDLPPGLSWPLDRDNDYHQFTSDFVAALRQYNGFEISVGAYPEKHPDAPSLDADIEALKKKCDAGATRAITQFFYDNDNYYRFIDKTQAAGIKVPVIPGILPIHDFAKMMSFATKCQAYIPEWLQKKFEPFKDSPEDAAKLAEDILTRQIADLAANNVPHIHFYTLNRANLTTEACHKAGLAL